MIDFEIFVRLPMSNIPGMLCYIHFIHGIILHKSIFDIKWHEHLTSLTAIKM